jgi:signal transduction histidine kinase
VSNGRRGLSVRTSMVGQVVRDAGIGDGRLSVQTSPGIGSTFAIRLPLG